MQKLLVRASLVAASTLLVAGPALAATLDFSSLPFFNPSPLVLSNATITNLTGASIFVGAGAAGEADGFCFGGFACAADGEISFSSAVSALSFDVDGWEAGDTVTIAAFNGGTSLGSLVASANSRLDFSGFGNITRLFFDDSSASTGVGYSTFSFNAAVNPTVPEPGSLALVGLALAGALTLRRRS